MTEEQIERLAQEAFNHAPDPEDGSTCNGAVNKDAHDMVMAAIRYGVRRSAEIAGAPAVKPVAVKVKPLEWEGAPAGGERYGIHEFGYYIITWIAPCYVVSTFTNKGAMRNVGQTRGLADAYKIADADYERRMYLALGGLPTEVATYG